MKRSVIIKGLIALIFAALSVSLPGQEKTVQEQPWEVGVNKRQPPDLVLKTIGIKPGLIIGEVGAGRGRVTVHLASRVGETGKIYANDIDREALNFLHKRCQGLGLNNVEIVLGTVAETKLPAAALDMVIMVNVVHCLAEPVPLLKNAGDSLKPDGQVVIVEGNLDKDPAAAGEWFSRAKLLKIFEDAGYRLVREETFLPKDNIYFLKKR